MLEDSLEFPLTADDWIQTVVIGGVLSFLGFLVLPAVVIQGYLLRTVRAAAEGDPAPSFTDWGELLVDGLRLFVLQFVVGVAVLVPFAVVFGFAGFFGGVLGSEAVAGAVALLGVLVVGVLALVAGYLLPAAVANFAVEDSMAAAFDVGTLLDGALTSDYAMAWLLAIVVGLFGGLLGSALSVVLVGVFVLFYVQVVTYYLFGRGFAAGLGTGAWATGDVGASGSGFGAASDDEQENTRTTTGVGSAEGGRADDTGPTGTAGGGRDGGDAPTDAAGRSDDPADEADPDGIDWPGEGSDVDRTGGADGPDGGSGTEGAGERNDDGRTDDDGEEGR
ncbi:MAG: DUF4013 domain-containing protein [Haloferacaceae archaeon]